MYSVVISDDNTIALSHSWQWGEDWLIIYQYNSTASWVMAGKFKLKSCGVSLAVYEDILVVGVPDIDDHRGLVQGRPSPYNNQLIGQIFGEQNFRRTKFFGGND